MKKNDPFLKTLREKSTKNRAHPFFRVCGVILLYTRKRPKKDVQTRSSHTNVNFSMDVQRMCEDVRTSFAHPFF